MKTINFVHEDEAEDSKALIVLLVGVMSILAICLSLWIGFEIGQELNQGAKPGQILAKSEMTKAEIKALNIPTLKGEKHGR